MVKTRPDWCMSLVDINGAWGMRRPARRSPPQPKRSTASSSKSGELQAYLTHVVSAKVDGFILSTRQLALWAALGVVGLTTAVGLVVTAVVLVLVEAADGFAVLFGGRWWLGALVVGGETLVLLVREIFIGMRIWHSRWHQQKVQQYDERQLQQQAPFGHSAADRATEATVLRGPVTGFVKYKPMWLL